MVKRLARNYLILMLSVLAITSIAFGFDSGIEDNTEGFVGEKPTYQQSTTTSTTDTAEDNTQHIGKQDTAADIINKYTSQDNKTNTDGNTNTGTNSNSALSEWKSATVVESETKPSNNTNNYLIGIFKNVDPYAIIFGILTIVLFFGAFGRYGTYRKVSKQKALRIAEDLNDGFEQSLIHN